MLKEFVFFYYISFIIVSVRKVLKLRKEKNAHWESESDVANVEANSFSGSG